MNRCGTITDDEWKEMAMNQILEISPAEAAQLEAAIDECLAAIESHTRAMRQSDTEIEALKQSTRNKLAEIERTLNHVEENL